MKNNRGFTIIEMIVTIAIMSIVLLTVLQIFVFTSKQYAVQQTRSYQMLLSDSIEEITKEKVRYATDVQVSGAVISGYNSIVNIDDDFYMDGSVFFGDDNAFGQKIEVEFHVVDDYSLGVDLRIYSGTGDDTIETINNFVCKLVNMELKSKELVDTGRSVRVSYETDFSVPGGTIIPTGPTIP